MTVQGRVTLEPDWTAADLQSARAALFADASPGLPGYADLG